MIKSIFLIASVLALASCGKKDEPTTTVVVPAGSQPAVLVSGTAQTLEAGCAHCVYKMDGVTACAVAVKVDGKPMLVTGVAQPGHDSGMCEHACTVEVVGAVQGDKFAATTLTVKP